MKHSARSMGILSAMLLLASCGYYAMPGTVKDFEPVEKKATYNPATHTLELPHPCPDWSHPSKGNFDNSLHSNYGCAAENNIAVQLENPEDYVRGHGTPGAYTPTGVRLIEQYRAGTIPTPLTSQQSE